MSGDWGPIYCHFSWSTRCEFCRGFGCCSDTGCCCPCERRVLEKVEAMAIGAPEPLSYEELAAYARQEWEAGKVQPW